MSTPRPPLPTRHSRSRPPRRAGRTRGLVAATVLVALALTACETPGTTQPSEVRDPTPQSIVPANWGANLQPRDVDLLYLPGGWTGCPGRLTFNDPCGGSQTLDIYPATRGTARGTLVWLHGGGFIAGEKYPLEELGPIKRLTHLGWSVVSAGYRKTDGPGGAFPAAAQDAAAALRWVRTNGPAFGLDTRRLVVGGYSSGGTLAGLMGTTANSGDPRFAGVPPLSGWVSLGGILDFTAGPGSQFWAMAWGLSPSQQEAGSPVTWWDPADPQGWLIHGDLDTLVDYDGTTRLMERAGSSGRVRRDTVDRFSDGTFMTEIARRHRIGVAMNSDALVEWLAALPTLERHAHPVGNVDVVRPAGANTVRVAGWTLDPDTPEPIDVHVYVDGRFTTSAPAQTTRGDVGRAYPLHGVTHGFSLTLDGLDPGNREICVYAINAAMGTFNPQLGCRSVTVTSG